MSDMDKDLFADATFCRIALKKFGKIGKLDPNFRLYEAGWLGSPPFEVMEVKGAIFRRALRGPRKGVLCIMVPGTHRTVHVTAAEMAALDKRKPKP